MRRVYRSVYPATGHTVIPLLHSWEEAAWRKKKMLAVVLAGALGACTGPATVIKEPQEVRIPVLIACEPKAVPVPKWATDAAPASCAGLPTVDAAACHYERVKAMGEELAQRIAYEVELRAVIDGCTGKKP